MKFKKKQKYVLCGLPKQRKKKCFFSNKNDKTNQLWKFWLIFHGY